VGVKKRMERWGGGEQARGSRGRCGLVRGREGGDGGGVGRSRARKMCAGESGG